MIFTIFLFLCTLRAVSSAIQCIHSAVFWCTEEDRALYDILSESTFAAFALQCEAGMYPNLSLSCWIYIRKLQIYLHFIAIINTVMSEEVNSLWPSDSIWRHRSMSTLAQIMASCLTAPSHYLSQCWLMISEVLWRSPNSNFTENTGRVST